MKILAIDQGNIESGYLVWDIERNDIFQKGKVRNEQLLELIPDLVIWTDTFYLAIEQIKSYGMPAGQTTFDSCVWAGRFIQKFIECGDVLYQEIPRKTYIAYFNKTGKGNDGTLRQALIDRFEPNLPPKKRPQGMLKNVSGDEWSALALAIYYLDKNIK